MKLGLVGDSPRMGVESGCSTENKSCCSDNSIDLTNCKRCRGMQIGNWRGPPKNVFCNVCSWSIENPIQIADCTFLSAYSNISLSQNVLTSPPLSPLGGLTNMRPYQSCDKPLHSFVKNFSAFTLSLKITLLAGSRSIRPRTDLDAAMMSVGLPCSGVDELWRALRVLDFN